MALPNNVVHLKPDGSKTVVDHSWTGDDRLDLLLHEAGRAKAPHRARAMRRAAKELGQAAAEGGVGFNHALGILKRLAEKNGMLEPASSWQGADSVVLARMETIAAETFLSVADAANREALKVELAWMDRSLSGTPAMGLSDVMSEAGGRLCHKLVVNRVAEAVALGDDDHEACRAPSVALPRIVAAALTHRAAMASATTARSPENQARRSVCLDKAKRIIREREAERATLEMDGKVVALPYPSPRPVRSDPVPAPQAIKPRQFVLRDPTQIPRRQWLYGTHLIRGEISATIAPGGVGKTSLAISEALAMVTGKPLVGVEVERPLRVWIWNGEEPLDELERRITAACLAHKLTSEDIGGRLFYDTGNEIPIVLAEQTRDGAVIAKPLIENLVRVLKDSQIDVMFVDPFVSTHNVTENDNNAIQKAATAWKDVARLGGVAIGLAHHSRKLQGRDATVEDSRGADALIAKCRDARALNLMSEADANKHGVEPMDRAQFFWTGPGGKSNMAQRTNAKTWFQMKSQALMNGESRFEPGDSVGVVKAWTPPAQKTEIPADKVAALGKIMEGGRWRRAPNATLHVEWIGRAVAEAFEIDPDIDQDWRKKVKPLIGVLKRKGYLVEAEGTDDRRHKVPVFVFANPERPKMMT